MNDQTNWFFDYFNKEIQKIKELDNRLYQKILCVTILDAMSRARYPSEKSNSHRIKNFIRNYGDWIDKDKVSLIQLQLNLESLPDQEKITKSPLFLFTKKQVSTWESGHVYDSGVDPIFDEMIKMVVYHEEATALKEARYLDLFYIYRNKLIHEFRKPGYAMEFGESYAFYMSFINAPWQLGFPVGMFEKLCSACLNNLKLYLQDNNIDPYAQYEFDSMWSERKRL